MYSAGLAQKPRSQVRGHGRQPMKGGWASKGKEHGTVCMVLLPTGVLFGIKDLSFLEKGSQEGSAKM